MIQSAKADSGALVRSSRLVCDGLNLLNDGVILKAKGCFRESLRIHPSPLAAFYLAKTEKIDGNHSAASAIAFACLQRYPSISQSFWLDYNIKAYLDACLNAWNANKDRLEAGAWDCQDVYNICIVSAAFKRERLFETFLDHYRRVSDGAPGINIDFAIAVSHGDGCKDICLDKSVNHVLVPNSPLSCKWQAALDLFMASDSEFCLVMGSDDFMSSSSLFSLCQAYTKYKCAVIGIKDLYIAHSCELLHWKGYSLQNQPARYGETIGAGRLIHRSFLNLLPGNIWGRKVASKGLDGIFTSSFRNLGLPTLGLSDLNFLASNSIELPPMQLAYDREDAPVSCLDVKLGSSSNVTPASSFLKMSNITRFRSGASRLCEILEDKITSELIASSLKY